MPHATADDDVKLYYEETGAGVPVVFVHEFAGDLRSWEPQLRHFGQRHRALAYNARGGSVAKIAAGCEWLRQATDQAATWNSSATKAAWARMSRPPILRTCPFLTIAIAS
jgi:pimeloyl-ACP methyl ester carboxylesterase